MPLNPDQIRRCLINLIDNSIASIQLAKSNQGQLRLIVEFDGHRFVKIEVSDNGVGIKSEDKSRIFDPYFTTKEAGTGLGLSIVASIVADHQGRIRVLDGTAIQTVPPIRPSPVTSPSSVKLNDPVKPRSRLPATRRIPEMVTTLSSSLPTRRSWLHSLLSGLVSGRRLPS